MTRAEILVEIEAEIARLVEVRRIMVESARAQRKIHTVTKKTVAAGTKKFPPKTVRKKHTLTPEGRRRIALGQKRRWARQRAAHKKSKK